MRLETEEDEALQLLPVEQRLSMVSYDRVLSILKSQSLLDEATTRAKVGRLLQPGKDKEGAGKDKEAKPARKTKATGALAGYMKPTTANFVGMATRGGGGSGAGRGSGAGGSGQG